MRVSWCLVAVCGLGCQSGTRLAGDWGEDVDASEDAGGEWGNDAVIDSGGEVAEVAVGEVDAGVDDADGGDAPPACGNGLIEFGEECDDGPGNSDLRADACRSACLAPRCGDGVVDSGERCDDGNAEDGDDCPGSCFPEDEPPAVLVGDPVEVIADVNSGPQPRIAWNGDGWGIIGSITGAGPGGEFNWFAVLEPDGHPAAPPRTLPFGAFVTGLVWRDGVYGVSLHGSSRSDPAGAALLDAEGTVVAGPSWATNSRHMDDLAWAPGLGSWIIGFEDARGGVSAIRMDDHGVFVDTPRRASRDFSDYLPLVVSSPAGVILAWLSGDAIRYTALPWTPGVLPETRLLLDGRAVTSEMARAAAYRTQAVISWLDRDAAEVRVARVDGWTLDGLGEAAALGPSNYQAAVLAAVPERGYLGACWGTTSTAVSATPALNLRLLRPDGRTLGPIVVVRDEMPTDERCAIAWSGTEFLVAYRWMAGGTDNRIVVQRVRPVI